MQKLGPLALVFCLLMSATAQDEDAGDDESGGVWIEHFDKASGKNFYYHSATRKTSWEAPAGAKVRYIDGASDGGGSSGRSSSKKSGTSSTWVLLGLLMPILVPLLALAACYWQATREGLADALKNMRAKREKARKRRGASAGGKFKQRAKLSQDGKGGRSANA